MKHTSFLFLCLFILFSCSDKASETAIEEKEKPNQVVLIFNNPVSNVKIEFESGRSANSSFARDGYEIETIDTTGIIRRHRIDFKKIADTVLIPSNRELLEVRLTYKGIDELTYYFEQGDTVIFNYTDLTPFAQIINRQVPFQLTNIQLYLRDSISKTQFPAILEAVNRGLPVENLLNENNPKSINWDEYIDQFRSKKGVEAVNQFRKLIATSSTWVKTEEEKMLLEKFTLNYYWTLQQWKTLTERLKARNRVVDAESFSVVEKFLKEVELDYARAIESDSKLFESINYQKALKDNIKQEYNLQMLEIKSKEAGARILDYAKYYDSIRSSSWIKPIEKRILQFEAVDQILSNGSFFDIEDRLKYLTKFKNDFQDTTLFNNLVKKYDVKFEIDDALKLVDSNGQETTLKGFVTENSNKVIYVDFWASWCAPCIKEMPNSKSLQNELSGQDILYLYLSTDRRNKAWLEAIEKHELNNGEHFRIMNSDNSIAMDQLQVQFIPRYMIFDKNGELVNKDAPRPSDKEKLIEEFNRYLGQQ